ncbi:MAG: TIGR02099 family protein [Gammaproteobacteria bacterium]|nr:MAG: TIGR02099 family protein [Gammaproteobacteria bacterium]
MRWLSLPLRFLASMLSVLLLLAVVLLALYASLGRLYMPRLAEQRDVVELFLEENVPFPVTFETLEGDWSQLSPIVRLKNIDAKVVIKGGDWAFHADDISVELDVIRSAVYWQPVLRDIRIAGGSVIMHGDRMQVRPANNGNAATPAGSGLSDLLSAIFNLGTVTISESRLRLNLPDMAEPRELVVSASLENADSFRRLRGDIRFDGDKPAMLSLVLEADQSLSGNLNVVEAYARWENVQLDNWLGSFDFGGDVRIARALAGEVWGYWVPGDEVRLHGSVSAPSISVTLKDKTWPELKSFSTRFLLERNAALAWEARFSDTRFDASGAHVPWQNLSVQYASGQPLRIGLEALDLTATHRLMDVLDVGRDAMSALQPQGFLRALSVSVDPSVQPLAWQVKARLDRVAIGSWHGAPTASGVSGYVEVDRLGGFVDLDAQDFSMGFPNVYANPMHFDRATAKVGWQVSDHGVTVSSSPITLLSPEGNAKGLLTLDLPKTGLGKDPWMTLVIGLVNAPAEVRNKYIPETISDGLQQWLDDSIRGGHVVQGGFIFDGPLKASDRKPVVQLFLDLEDASLQYHPQWPGLTRIDGRLLVDDGDVTVWAKRAALYGSEVKDARVEVAPDEAGDLLLTVQSGLQGPTGDVLSLLQDSPLRSAVGETFNGWKVDGRFKASLLLGVSLAGRAEPYVAVDATLADNRLALTGQRLVFANLAGPLRYRSDSGLSSTGLSAELWKNPLTAVISSQHDDAGMQLDIRATSLVTMDGLREWMDWPWLSFAQGEAEVQADIAVRPGLAPMLSLSSGLQGVTMQLPAPFTKPQDATWPLRANIPLSGDGMMDIAVGQNIRIGVLTHEDEPAWVGVALGQVPFRLPQSPGISLYGRLEQFDWSQWQSPVLDMVASVVNDTDEAPSTTEGGGFRVSGVFVNDLTVFDQHFDSMLVSVRQTDDRWWVGFQGEQLVGRVGLPSQDAEPYRVELDRLRLAKPASTGADDLEASQPDADAGDVVDVPDEQDAALMALDWSEWPDVDVLIRELKVDDADFGRWSFRVRPSADRLRVSQLQSQSTLLRIDAENGGAWIEWIRPELQTPGETRVFASVLIHDMEGVFRSFGFDPGVTAEQAVFGIDVSWQGLPTSPVVHAMQGRLGVDFQKGFIKSGNRAQTGALKALSLFNLDTVLRRIQLDFSDLYHQGLAFDRAKATIHIADGWMSTTEPLVINGPSSHIVMQGKMDVVNDALDYQLTVTLPVASSLPWLAAIAGGLPAAVGVYVASKVLEKQVNSFTSLVYDVSGSLANPEVKFRRLVDTDSLIPSWLRLPRKTVTPSANGEGVAADTAPVVEPEAAEGLPQ